MTAKAAPAKLPGREVRLAMALQAIDDLDAEFAETRAEYKERRTRLMNQAMSQKRDILTGQKSLLDTETGDV